VDFQEKTRSRTSYTPIFRSETHRKVGQINETSHNTGQNNHLLTASKSFENVAKLKYLRMTKKLQLHSQGNYEYINFRACLLAFSSECVTLLCAVYRQ